MSKKKQRQFARRVAREIIRELARTPAPAPAGKAVKTQAEDILAAALEHAATSARIAGFDSSAGELLLSAGFTPAGVAIAFADSLSRLQ